MVKHMPKVVDCVVKQCFYNMDGRCHALGINIGGSTPCCDTFNETTPRCVDVDVSAGVGACKVRMCRFNDCLMCCADGVRIKWDNGIAKCDTYKPR